MTNCIIILPNRERFKLRLTTEIYSIIIQRHGSLTAYIMSLMPTTVSVENYVVNRERQRLIDSQRGIKSLQMFQTREYFETGFHRCIENMELCRILRLIIREYEKNLDIFNYQNVTAFLKRVQVELDQKFIP